MNRTRREKQSTALGTTTTTTTTSTSSSSTTTTTLASSSSSSSSTPTRTSTESSASKTLHSDGGLHRDLDRSVEAHEGRKDELDVIDEFVTAMDESPNSGTTWFLLFCVVILVSLAFRFGLAFYPYSGLVGWAISEPKNVAVLLICGAR